MSINNKIDDNDPDANLIVDEQVARSVAALLNDNAQHLNAVTLQRLTTARNQAVNQLEVHRRKAIHGVSHSGNVLQWLGHGFEQHRMMSIFLIAGAMLLGFIIIQEVSLNNSLNNSDALLLASELPPEAFADKGFDKWLVSKRD